MRLSEAIVIESPQSDMEQKKMKLNEAIQFDKKLLVNESFLDRITGKTRYYYVVSPFSGDELFRVPGWLQTLMDVEILGISGAPLAAMAGGIGTVIFRTLILPLMKDEILARQYPKFNELRKRVYDLSVQKRKMTDEQIREEVRDIVAEIHVLVNSILADPDIDRKQRIKVSNAASSLYNKIAILT